MARDRKELDRLARESVQREEQFVKEYKRTHPIPSRGRILTPEIQAELDLQKQLYAERMQLKREEEEAKKNSGEN